MEKSTVIGLLEKYFQAETTLAEEKALAEYFEDVVDPELAPYQEMFRYFGQESEVTAGPAFGERILQRVGLSARPARRFHLGFIAAAASICAIVAGLFWMTPGDRKTTPAVAVTTIHDTYDDPEQALAAVRHALLIASTHLNEGRRSITGDKTRSITGDKK